MKTFNDNAKEKADEYINSILQTNKDYGFTKEVPKEEIEKAKLDVEKIFRKFQRLLTHS